MSLKEYPQLRSFLITYFAENDSDQDEGSAKSFAAATSDDKRRQVVTQARAFTGSASLVEDLGMEVNRWFGDADEARTWIEQIASLLDTGESSDNVVVKDSNGAPLSEGDAVTVIKDLKVKGGSSDLKRGTLIKKVHLIGDPDNIECNVGGSTLVLKTIFLKKA